MKKEIIKNILKTSSAEFTKEEIQSLLDEELKKDVEEMDTELVELCIEALSRESDVNDGNSGIIDDGNIKKIKSCKIKKIFILAAVISIISIISISAAANVFVVDAETGIVSIFGNLTSINFKTLKNKEIENINYDEFEDVYLFPVFRSDTCNLIEKETTSDTFRKIEFTFADSGISGSILIDINSIYNTLPGSTNIATKVEQIKQTEIDGVDTLIISTATMEVQIFYNAGNDYYTITIPDISFNEALELLKNE